MQELDKVLELYLSQKAPSLPKNIKDLLVQFAPWLTLIGVVIGLPGVLALFGMGALFSSFPMMGYGYGMMRAGGNFYLWAIVMTLVIVLEALAIPGLFAKTRQGWNFLFYSVLVGVISSAVVYNFTGMIIGTLISLYLLYQVKSYYK